MCQFQLPVRDSVIIHDEPREHGSVQSAREELLNVSPILSNCSDRWYASRLLCFTGEFNSKPRADVTETARKMSFPLPRCYCYFWLRLFGTVYLFRHQSLLNLFNCSPSVINSILLHRPVVPQDFDNGCFTDPGRIQGSKMTGSCSSPMD